MNIPATADAMIVFAHGSGSSRHSPRNKYVATMLGKAGFATLLFDLLTREEDRDFSNRFNIPLIAERLAQVTEWLKNTSEVSGFDIGFFGASTGAAAALDAAALNTSVKAVVSRGGRPELASRLSQVKAPTLLIVGSLDTEVIALNQHAWSLLRCEKDIVIVPGATHLFEEEGKIEQVAQHASSWFAKYLKGMHA